MLCAIPRHCLRTGSSIVRSVTRIQLRRNFAEEAAASGMLFTFASPTEVKKL